MNNLQIFNNPEFGEIRAIEKDGEPWFVLKDVCDTLGLSSPHKVAERLERDERNQIPVIDSMGRQQDTIIINEYGLYKVIFRSDKPKAKPFTNWVTHEVLPSIRKTGGYQTARMSPEVSPQGLAKLINITRRVMLDMGSTPAEVAAMVQSVFITWNVPVPYTLAKNIPEQLLWSQKSGTVTFPASTADIRKLSYISSMTSTSSSTSSA